MKLAFTPLAWDQYLWWQQNDRQKLRQLNRLLLDCLRNGTEGIGTPERLKHNLEGLWSRRIDQEHRLVYGVEDDQILVYQCRFHYD